MLKLFRYYFELPINYVTDTQFFENGILLCPYHPLFCFKFLRTMRNQMPKTLLTQAISFDQRVAHSFSFRRIWCPLLEAYYDYKATNIIISLLLMANVSVSHFIALKAHWSILKKIEHIQEYHETQLHTMTTKTGLFS